MTTVNRTAKFKSLHEFLRNQMKLPPKPPARNVLEQLIYSACLENAPYESAEAAFAVLEHHYIDWNEIRISTAKELASTLPQLPDPVAAGERIRRILYDVFDTMNQFDLDELRKRGTSQAMEYLHSLHACTRFMADFMHQIVFGTHTIPVDEYTMRVFRLLGLTKILEEEGKEIVSGVERAILKNEGADFTARLHQFAAIHAADTKIENLRHILVPLDTEVMSRPWAAPIFINKPVKPKTPIRLVPQIAASFLSAPAFVADEEDEGSTEFVAAPELEFIPHALPPLTEDTVTKSSVKTTKSPLSAKPVGTASPKPLAEKPKEKIETKKKPDKANTPCKETAKSPSGGGDEKVSTLPPKTPAKPPAPIEKENAKAPVRGKKKATEPKKTESSTPVSPTRLLQQKKPR